MNFVNGFLGERTPINSRTWGPMLVEAASFTAAVDGDLIVQFGEPAEHSETLVRIHSECVFAQALDSDLCDCADQLRLALDRLVANGHGLLFYLRLDGRGVGLAAKVKATALEVQGVDTHESRIRVGVSPEGRNFTSIGKYLSDRGIRNVRLLTNNPDKIEHLRHSGINVIREPLYVANANQHVRQLYKTKAERFNHILPKDAYA